MAELDVQPKRNNPWWIWLLLALIALALIFFLTKGCNDNKDSNAVGDTTASTSDGTLTDSDDGWWNTVNFDAPAAAYSEVSDRDIDVRGDSTYAVYSLDETVLFDSNSGKLKQGSEEKLKQISTSVNQRFANGQVRVYGYTDAEGSAEANKKLAEERAAAVKDWLVTNGSINSSNVSVHPVGEAQPVASNATEEGKQKNRRVQIVVRSADAGNENKSTQ